MTLVPLDKFLRSLQPTLQVGINTNITTVRALATITPIVINACAIYLQSHRFLKMRRAIDMGRSLPLIQNLLTLVLATMLTMEFARDQDLRQKSIYMDLPNYFERVNSQTT